LQFFTRDHAGPWPTRWYKYVWIGRQQLIGQLDSRTLRPVNVLCLLVFSNNKNGISDIRDNKRRIMT